jgi:hypothetical protein
MQIAICRKMDAKRRKYQLAPNCNGIGSEYFSAMTVLIAARDCYVACTQAIIALRL